VSSWSLRAGLFAGAQFDCVLKWRGNSEARSTVRNNTALCIMKWLLDRSEDDVVAVLLDE
jgi:hypothetical protein